MGGDFRKEAIYLGVLLFLGMAFILLGRVL